ncbi:hypothetical protein [Streptomyces sp. NPDC052693]|uniref:hypothetical protein n=1 Tax=Streptomyces sp. NPDC052693 TaxID=3155814 RepID=UPI003432AF97
MATASALLPASPETFAEVFEKASTCLSYMAGHAGLHGGIRRCADPVDATCEAALKSIDPDTRNMPSDWIVKPSVLDAGVMEPVCLLRLVRRLGLYPSRPLPVTANLHRDIRRQPLCFLWFQLRDDERNIRQKEFLTHVKKGNCGVKGS